jgi:Protein of unknown function (DUF3237)
MNPPPLLPLIQFTARTTALNELPRAAPGAKLSICYFTEGQFAGDRLRGEVLPGGGDWAVFRSESELEIDVRALLRETSGALIYLRYWGVWVAPSGFFTRLFDPDGLDGYDPSGHYFRVTARFETAASNFLWLNNLLAVGVGRITPDRAVYYDFFQVG